MRPSAWVHELTHDIMGSDIPSQWSAGDCFDQACSDAATSRNTDDTSSTESGVNAPEVSNERMTSGAMCVEASCSDLRLDSTRNADGVDATGCNSDRCMTQTTRSAADSRAARVTGPFRTTTQSHTTPTATAGIQSANEAACPVLLPRCLSTWLFISPCSNNTDSDCFCRSEDLVTGAIGCVDAWSQSMSDRNAATLCLQGICVRYISQNPAIMNARQDNPQSSTPKFICPHNRDLLGHSQQLCTTVMYRPVVPDSTGWSLVTTGLTAHFGMGRVTTAATTVTLPLIYLGTFTVTRSRTISSGSTATMNSSQPGLPKFSFGPYTYHPGNASRTLHSDCSATPDISMPSLRVVKIIRGGLPGNKRRDYAQPTSLACVAL